MKTGTYIRPKFNWADIFFSNAVKILAAVAVLILIFAISTICNQSIPVLSSVGLAEFWLSENWMPIDVGTTVSFGIRNFILATLLVSMLALCFAFIVSLFASLYLANLEKKNFRAILYAGIDLFAGIPSVIYGFVGLVVLVKIFIDLGHDSGLCVLASSIVLAIMLLPFMISSFSESLRKVKSCYKNEAANLGIDRWFFLISMVLPVALPHFIVPTLKAFARGVGETMAVMMVVGNANLFPEILGKSETIASLIALEMGTAVGGSLHASALFASGATLMMLVLVVNALSSKLSKILTKNSATSKSVSLNSQLLTKIFRSLSYVAIATVVALLLFIFCYCASKGASLVTLEFLTASPSGSVLGESGGIYPAIFGSVLFVAVALLVALPLSLAFAIYRLFFCKNARLSSVLDTIFSVCAGIPSIVIGLFVYAVFVRSLGFGRSVISGGIALGLMILPFLEVRFETAFKEFPKALKQCAANLGCSNAYVIRKLVLPYCLGDIISTLALGASFALGACAPLIFTGGVAFAPVTFDVTSPAMALPLHLYLMLAQQSTMTQVYATALVLLVLVFVVNLAVSAISIQRKQKWKQ